MNNVTSSELDAVRELNEERIKRIDEAIAHLRELGDEVNLLRSWQARLGGGILVVAFIGVTNLIKVWGGG